MNRAYAIDVLRCLAIVGMVLSGQIFWNSELPSWMFHAQTPPPLFVFNPTVPGITWVDLVFPFFLFSMGAAFPLAMDSKIKAGVSNINITFGIIKRWLLLSLFAIALANTRQDIIAQVAGPNIQALMLIATWGLFFCMFVRLPKLSRKVNTWLNLGGALGIIGLLLLYKYGLGLPVSLYKSDVIIMILANMALFGTILWWLTHGNILARVGIIALLVALRIGGTVDGSWNESVMSWTPAGWLYRSEYLKYLCIVLPGTIAGDMISKWMRNSTQGAVSSINPILKLVAMVAITALFCVVMWSLFSRHIVIGVVTSILLGIAILLILRRDISDTGKLHYKIVAWGFFWLLLGLALEAWEGGIKKDHATLSYFFVTSGLASFAVTVISMLINYYRVNMNFLVKCGQNPMIAYTASGYIVVPLITLLQLGFVLQWMMEAGPWMGVLRGVVVTALMMLVTAFFTMKKIFWKT